MARGDQIYVERLGVYTHHAVDLGDGTVIHRSTSDGTKSGATIRMSTVEEFSGSGRVQIKNYGMRLSAEDAVARAESMLGESGYHLMFDNCEHFATWCVNGEYESQQVHYAVSGTQLLGLGIATPSAGVRLVTTLGHGPARSGPNLMSGLARLGGNTTTGLCIAAATVGAATTWGMCQLVPDKPSLPDDERSARRNARYGAAAGAIGGTALGLHAVGAMGVAGYSAAGMSSGLAALGSTLGGGMAMGVSMALALPAILAIALGYAMYRLTQYWSQHQTTRARPRPDLGPAFGGTAAA